MCISFLPPESKAELTLATLTGNQSVEVVRVLFPVAESRSAPTVSVRRAVGISAFLLAKSRVVRTYGIDDPARGFGRGLYELTVTYLS